MGEINKTELLKISLVTDEIQRHLWIESEKAGYDRGIEWATEDWLDRYAKAWIAHNLPQELQDEPTTTSQKPRITKRSRLNDHLDNIVVRVKKRRAKSYISF
jgi:hypothetical protein